jgi:hypothetical protein
MHAFQMKTTKSIVTPKVKGGHNLEPDLTTLREELKAALDTTVEGREKYKNWLEPQELLAQGQSIMAEQVSNNRQNFSIL